MNLSLPEQKVSRATKQTKKWIEGSMNAIISRSFGGNNGVRSSHTKKKINYDLVNGIVDMDDFTHVTKPYGNTVDQEVGKLPAKFQNYNRIKQAIQQLLGEELSRPFNWTVRATGGEGLNLFNKKYEEELQNSYLAILEAAITNKEITEQPADVDKYFKNSYKSNIEITANKLLGFLIKDLKLEKYFNIGFKDYLIAGEEIYYVSIFNNEPKLKVINPVNFDCDLTNNNGYIEDCDWAVYREYLDRGVVLDEYGDILTKSEKKMLDNPAIYNSLGPYQQVPSVINTYLSNFNGTNKILVRTCAWKSYKEIGIVNYPDEKGQMIKEIISEDEIEIYEAQGISVQVEWVPETMIGIQIGADIFKCFPHAFQANTVDNPYKSSLPFIGGIANALNSEPTGLVDMLKPYQYTYNIIWYRLELEFARASGKKVIFDVAKVPKSKGWSFEEWMYYANTMGFMFINSAEIGENGINSQNNFNQEIDMSISNNVSVYFDMLNKIEDCIDLLSGITAQRRGNTSPSETATGVNTAIQQSYALTEIYFYEHSLVKERVLTYLLETAKFAYRNNEKGKLVFDQFTREVLETNTLQNSQLGIYVTNSSKDYKVLETLRAAAQAGIDNGALEFSNLITIIESNSIAEIKSNIKESEERQHAMKAQEQQTAQAQIDSQERIAREQMDRQDTNAQLERENKLQIATINSLRSKEGATDVNNDGMIDQLQVAQLGLEQSRESFKQQESNNKLSLEMKKMELEQANFNREQDQQDKKNAQDAIFKKKELELKEKDIEVKKKALKYKARPATKK